MRALSTLSLFVLAAATALTACSSDKKTPAAPTTAVPDAGTTITTGPIALAAGEVAEIEVVEGRAQARFTTSDPQSLLLIVGSTKLESSAGTLTYSTTLEAEGDDTGIKKLDACALSPWSEAKASAETAPSGTAPAVGTTKKMSFSSGITSETIDVRAAAVGERAIVWVDETPAHPATLEKAFVDEFLADFESTILPRLRTLFGMESDLDGDGRISLVFSPLTKNQAVAFFTGCDLAKLKGCGAGNSGEYLYLTPPANIDPPYNTPAAIKETLAHELGHLLHFNRKVLRNKLTSWPDGSYMIEGFGGFTQDVSGYQAGNFYVAQAGLEKIDDFSLADVYGNRQDYDSKRDGVLRGGGYWFVRYLYDRGGGDDVASSGALVDNGGPSLLRAWLDAPSSISEGIAARAKPEDVAMDFYTALALSNESKSGAVDPKNACFSFLPAKLDPLTNRQRGGDPRAEFHGQKLTGPKTKALASADGKLRAGGVEYLTFASGAGETTVRVNVDGAAGARVRVARTK